MTEVRHQLSHKRYSHVAQTARAECICGERFAVTHHWPDQQKGAAYAKDRVVEIFNEHRGAATREEAATA